MARWILLLGAVAAAAAAVMLWVTAPDPELVRCENAAVFIEAWAELDSIAERTDRLDDVDPAVIQTLESSWLRLSRDLPPELRPETDSVGVFDFTDPSGGPSPYEIVEWYGANCQG